LNALNRKKRPWNFRPMREKTDKRNGTWTKKKEGKRIRRLSYCGAEKGKNLVCYRVAGAEGISSRII